MDNVITVKENIDVTEAYKNTTADATTFASITNSSGTLSVRTEETAQSQGSTQTTVTVTETEATTENLATSENSVTTTENEVTNAETTTETEFIDILGSFDNEDARTSTTTTTSTTESPGEAHVNKTERMEKLSDQIRAVISHYKKYGKVTVPDASVPDPMALPKMKKSFGGFDMTFTNQRVYGLSNYSIEHVNTDLDKMQVGIDINKIISINFFSPFDNIKLFLKITSYNR